MRNTRLPLVLTPADRQQDGGEDSLPLGKPLYKHTKQRHADALLNRGEFYLGTIAAYRRFEGCAPDQVDDREGTALKVLEAGNPDEMLNEAQLEFIKPIIDVRGAELSVSRGIQFEVYKRMPNALAYCVSRTPENLHIFKEADATVQICQPGAFWHELTKDLTTQHPSLLKGGHIRSALGAVRYNDIEYQWDHPDKDIAQHRYFTKRTQYQPEQEARFVWELPNEDFQPVIVKSRAAAKFCKLYTMRPPSA